MSNENQKSNIVDLGAVREYKAEERRRLYERIIFKQMLGVYSVVEENGLKAIDLVDVSEDGLSFQLPYDSKFNAKFEVGQNLAFRFYFSQESYLPILVRLQNVRDTIENGQRFKRYGCAVDTQIRAYAAYKTFVEFLKSYGEFCQSDRGSTKLFFV